MSFPTASAVTAETYLINVESGANANKFYRATLHDDGTVVKNWGRVGAAGQTRVERGGRHAYDVIVSQKLGRGYTKVDVVSPTTGPTRPAPPPTPFSSERQRRRWSAGPPTLCSSTSSTGWWLRTSTS